MNKFIMDGSALLVILNSELNADFFKRFYSDSYITQSDVIKILILLYKYHVPVQDIGFIYRNFLTKIIDYNEDVIESFLSLLDYEKKFNVKINNKTTLAHAIKHNYAFITADLNCNELNLDIPIITPRNFN